MSFFSKWVSQAYNLIQLLGWSYIFYLIILEVLNRGIVMDLYGNEEIRKNLNLYQCLQVFDIVFAVMKYTKTNPVVASIQTFSRVAVTFFFMRPDLSSPFTSVVVLPWTLAEIIRFSYYLTSGFNIKIKVITWL